MLSKKKLLSNLDSKNLAKFLKDDDLKKLGEEVKNSYENDEQSRSTWKEQYKVALALAAQIVEKKTSPWPGAANVKYPLITMACVEFQARSSLTLLNSVEPIKGKALGYDDNGEKQARAGRVGKYMSHHAVNKMNDWIGQTDRMLMVLPLTGVAYKKSYISNKHNSPVSPLVLPQNLCINYGATDFDLARKTHIYKLPRNEVVSLQRKQIFLNTVKIEQSEDASAESIFASEVEDRETNIVNVVHDQDDSVWVLEQHYEWDIDGDGYKEPYIITCLLNEGTVLRVVPRYTESDIEYAEDGETIAEITGTNFFTRFTFLPSFTSNIYGLGFGVLLGPLNDSVNTIINQLIDSGTMATRQAGFIGKGVKLGNKSFGKFAPGMWKSVQSTGDDIKKAIFPLPTKEPSSVLFQLLSLLIQVGEETSAVADLMKGNSPGQNQPWATTSALLEQGMQVFSGIYKRIYRSLAAEYKLLYSLFSQTVTEADYVNVLADVPTEGEDPSNVRSIPHPREDFDQEDFDILPTADPDVTSKTQQFLKVEGLMQAMERGAPLNPQEVSKRLVEAQGHDNPEALISMPEPQPDPELEFEMLKHQQENELAWAQLMVQVLEIEGESVKDSSQAAANLARAESMTEQVEVDRMKAVFEFLAASENTEGSAKQAVLNALTKIKTEKMRADSKPAPSSAS